MLLSDIRLFVCLSVAALFGLAAIALLFRRYGIGPIIDLVGAYRRQSVPAKMFMPLFVGALIAYGSNKAPTNPPPVRTAAHRGAGMVVRNEPWYTGTNETWDFECPDWASEVVPWGCRGAYADWISCGSLGVIIASGRILTDGEELEVFDRPLAIVPGARTPGTDEAGKVWYGRAPWGADVYTWRNAHVERDATNVVSVQLERMRNGDRIYRYGNVDGVTSRAYVAPRPAVADSDGDGIPDADDGDFMNPDADGDGLVDGMTRAEYDNHPLWRTNNADGEPMDIRLNEPVVPPAMAVLKFDTLRILLTTNAVFRVNLQQGVRYDVELITNGLQPVNLSAERGAD